MNRVPKAALAASCLAGALLAAPGAWAQEAACSGGSTVVQRGDTLSVIAARCDVSEGAILAANPRIDGSADLVVGQSIALNPPAGSASGIARRLDSFATKADDAFGRVANEVGSSAQDLLDKNPDLKSRLESLGRQVGIGRDAAMPAASVAPDSGPAGSTVTVSATNLPADSVATVAAGIPGLATETLVQARTSASGTLSANVVVPAAMSGNELVFTVRMEDAVAARTGRFKVTP